MEQLRGYRFNKRLYSWDSDEDYTLLFEQNDDVRVVCWTVRDTPVAIGIPASHGIFEKVTSNGELTTTIAPGERGEFFGVNFMPKHSATYLRFEAPNNLLLTAASATRLPLEWSFRIPGQAPLLRFRFKNYSRQTLYTRLTSLKNRSVAQWVMPGREDDKQTVPGGQIAEIVVGASASMEAFKGASLMLGIETAESAFAARDATFAIAQKVQLIPRNSLSITRLPSKPEEVVVKVENPSGEFWRGTASPVIFSGHYKGGISLVADPAELVLPEQVPYVIARFTIKKDAPSSWAGGVNAISLHSPTEPRAIYPIPIARPFELDLPNVQVVGDGDPKVKATTDYRPGLPPEGALLEGTPTLGIRYEFQAGWKCLRVVNPTWPPPSEKELLGQP